MVVAWQSEIEANKLYYPLEINRMFSGLSFVEDGFPTPE